MKNNSTFAHLPFPYVLRFSESLNQFLIQRSAENDDFVVSEWLDSLSPYLLNLLDENLELASDSNSCPEIVRTDMKSVCEIALVAEKRIGLKPRKKNVSRQWIKNLQLVAAFVSLSKAGYIQLCAPLALSTNENVQFTFTEAGRRLGIALGPLAK